MFSLGRTGRSPLRWPLLVALGAAVSLLLVERFFPSEERLAARDASEIRYVRRLLETRDLEPAERRLKALLSNRPRSPSVPEARFLLGQTLFQQWYGRRVPGERDVEEAWSELTQARETGYPAAQVFSVQERIADFLIDRGRFSLAAARLEDLYRSSGDRKFFLPLSRVYYRQLRGQPEKREELLPKATLMINEYLASAETPDEKVTGLVERARLHWETGEFSLMRDLLDDAVLQFPQTRLLPLLKLERGKALSFLGQEDAALTDLRNAVAGLKEADLRDLALVHQVMIRVRRHDSECQRIVEPLIHSGSRYRPLARLQLGQHFLETNRARPYRTLLLGLREMPDPALVESERVDIERIYSRLTLLLGQASSAIDLLDGTEIIEEFRRLYPEDRRYVVDAAALYQRAGGKRKEEALLREREGDEAGAAEARREAAELFDRSGEVFLEASRRPSITPDLQGAYLRQAAQAFFEGGLYLRAAEQYRNFFILLPNQNHEGLYLEGVSYAAAGIYTSGAPAGRDAWTALSEYIQMHPEGSVLVPRALLERGRIQLQLGLYRDASADFDRVIRDPGFGLGPQTPEWSEGLRGRGMAELKRAQQLREKVSEDPALQPQFVSALRAAQAALTEYVERYAEDRGRQAGVLESSFQLARSYLVEENWAEAERWFRQTLLLAPSLSTEVGEETEEALRQAHFLLGETLFLLGRFEESQEAFRTAYNRYNARPERLWGLIGQARSELRLGKKDEAARLHRRARDIYDRNSSAYAVSLEGMGAETWGGALDDLDRELKRTE